MIEFQIYRNLQGNGQFYWRLVAGNNKIIADGGEGYENYDDLLESINNITRKVRSGDYTIKRI